MEIRKLALIALLGGALMAFGCGDSSDGEAGTGGDGGGGAGGAGGDGGGGAGGGNGEEQVALYDVACTLNIEGLGEFDVALTADLIGSAAGDLVVGEATEVTTKAEVSLPEDLLAIIGNFNPEITSGAALLGVSNATPTEIEHEIPTGAVESPIETDTVTTDVVADAAGDVVIEPTSTEIGIFVPFGAEGLSLNLVIPGDECPDGFVLQEGSDPITFEATE